MTLACLCNCRAAPASIFLVSKTTPWCSEAAGGEALAGFLHYGDKEGGQMCEREVRTGTKQTSKIGVLQNWAQDSRRN